MRAQRAMWDAWRYNFSMTIVFRRWYWALFACLWFSQIWYWRLRIGHSPDGPAVMHFLRSLGWDLMPVALMTATYAFFTTVVVTTALRMVFRDPERS